MTTKCLHPIFYNFVHLCLAKTVYVQYKLTRTTRCTRKYRNMRMYEKNLHANIWVKYRRLTLQSAKDAPNNSICPVSSFVFNCIIWSVIIWFSMAL